MTANELIAQFERMYEEHWAYEWGAAREGVVDCSGAFVVAFKQYGQSIAHGSNTIARTYIASAMRPASQAKPGWAVFKRRFDGGEPERYQSDGLGNYYHIGLCGRDGKQVLNAKSAKAGFSSDALDKFDFAAPLKGVDYEEEDEAMTTLYQARVVTKSGPLNVRANAVNGQVLGTVPKGAVVDVLEEGDWPLIRYGTLVGYASGAYLERVDDAPQGGQTAALVITDSAGNVFRPVGGFTVTLENAG